ncbi:hypothetical protein [Brachybacterium paraconglomeratum]|uniref:hypothetical protein n=1 Tax=Brachybacterium paraconglomeratum TaxID=173362 RepID=UPI0022E842A0|nr:hypothetical protein [Brachybacterium paraconglomeratum]
MFVAVTSPHSSGGRENDQLGARGGDLDGREELAYVLPSVVRGRSCRTSFDPAQTITRSASPSTVSGTVAPHVAERNPYRAAE